MLKHRLKRRWSRTLCTAALVAVGVCLVAIPAITVKADDVRVPHGSASHVSTVVKLHQRQVTVTIHNFKFGPPKLAVSRGTRVVWVNKDSDPHTVTSDKKVWASEALDNNAHFTHVFKTAGTLPYHCTIHPYMHGVITVKP